MFGLFLLFFGIVHISQENNIADQPTNREAEIQLIMEKLDNESWEKNPKNIIESLAQDQCRRMNNEETERNELVREIRERIKETYCRRSNQREKSVVEGKTMEIVAKLSAIFREDGPKSVEKLREAEESDQKLLEDPRFVRACGWLRTVEAKMEPGADKDAVGRVLRKQRVKPSDMMGLGLELWTMATTPSCAQPQVAPQQQQPLRVHRRRRRMPESDWGQPPKEDWAKLMWPAPPGPEDPARKWQRRAFLLLAAMVVAFAACHSLVLASDLLIKLLGNWLVLLGLFVMLFNYLDNHTPTILLNYI